jgi:hypothetical protein
MARSSYQTRTAADRETGAVAESSANDRRSLRALVSGLVLVVAVVSTVVAVALTDKTTPSPSFQDLPAPAALAEAFDAKPVGIGQQVPPALVPVPVWSGAVEELSGPLGTVVAYDGPGTYPHPVAGVSVGSQVAPGVARIVSTATGGRQLAGLLGVTSVPGGWVALCAWSVPSQDQATVAARIAAALGVWHAPLLDPATGQPFS